MSKIATKPPENAILHARKAADLMTPNPISVREADSLKHAVAVLVDRGIHSVPVINEEEEPVGVLSATDVVARRPEDAVPDFYLRHEFAKAAGEPLPKGFQVEETDRTLVRDCMSPVVYSVPRSAPAHRVVSDLVDLGVHQLYVIDANGTLGGVISGWDVLRHLLDETAAEKSGDVVLDALTAAEMMMSNPLSLEEDASIEEAREFLTMKSFSAAPVIDAAGRPIGVVSLTDLVIHERENVVFVAKGNGLPRRDPMKVGDLMTPVVFGVGLETPAREVVSRMIKSRVHRLFVMDDAGVLVGVVSTRDVLRHLRVV